MRIFRLERHPPPCDFCDDHAVGFWAWGGSDQPVVWVCAEHKRRTMGPPEETTCAPS